MLRTVIGLRFALSLRIGLGASITACFLPFLLLLLSGDVEPNPGPPKRKGELVHACRMLCSYTYMYVYVCVCVYAAWMFVPIHLCIFPNYVLPACCKLSLHALKDVVIVCVTTYVIDHLTGLRNWPVLQTGSGTG